MTILTDDEARAILRLDPIVDDPEVDPPIDLALDLVMSAVDDYLKTATGHDWAEDEEIDKTAKLAAQMLLVQWYENPAMIGTIEEMHYGISNVIGQLQVKAIMLAGSS
jgi:hypothetical protein